MFRDIFKDSKYPELLNAIDTMKLSRLPPWEFLYENHAVWKNDFVNSNISKYSPFARMINDDVIAAINTVDKTDEIYLFILPLSSNAKPFKTLDNINLWLKLALEDCYEYLIEY